MHPFFLYNDSLTFDPGLSGEPMARLGWTLPSDTAAAVSDWARAASVRYSGIPIPSTPATETWPDWLLLILGVLLLLIHLFTPGFISSRYATIFEEKERDSIFTESSLVDIRTFLASLLFVVGGLSMSLYLIFPTVPFTLSRFFRICGLVSAFFVAKWLVYMIVSYTFLPPKQRRRGLRTYQQLLLTASIPLYVFDISAILLTDGLMLLVPSIVLIACLLWYALVLVYKSFQLFYVKSRSALYLFLYLCTLEFLPWFGLIFVLQNKL